MSERWEPKHGEAYYFVDSIFVVGIHVWKGDAVDAHYHKCGNCFHTKEEAHSAAEKMKGLMLSLHDNDTAASFSIPDTVPKLEVDDRGVVLDLKPLPDTLPKLTVEIFNRQDCPEDAKIAVVNQDGSACFGSFATAESVVGFWRGEGDGKWFPLLDKWDASDWQKSLIERPAKLPEWCTVGEWVYLCNGTYSRIASINDCHVNLENGISVGKNSIHAEMVSARLRPYNADEMRGLVGKVVTTSSGRHCTLVTACKQEYSVIEPQVMLNKWLYATDLLHGGNTIDGKPCGVFEHRENGEWVE